jgi:allantoate deiminase
VGLIAPHEPDSLRDVDGITIADAMRSCGLDPARIPDARRSDVAAFIECHIEQGPRLEGAGARLGIVEWVVGVRQREFRFAGMSGHAGTIPMEQRRDALVAAAEFVTSTYRTALEAGNGAVATVGTMVVHPGGSNQIPGDALLTVDFRHSDETTLDELERRLVDGARETANRNGVELSTSERLNQRPVSFDPELRHIIERSCEEVGPAYMRLASGAGHDAQLFARHMPAAMLFVPSKGGRSHRPDEDTDIDDIVAGIEVLIRTLYRLAYVSP